MKSITYNVTEENKKIKSFRDLNVWKNGLEIVQNIYKLTKRFPKSEIYGLISQMRRASISVPSNIAEGFARKHNNEYKQCLYISLSSLAELETQLEISCLLGYVIKDSEEIYDLFEKMEHTKRMILNLIKCL